MTKPQLNIPLNPCPFKQEGEQHEVHVLPQGSGYPEMWQVVCSCGACGPVDLGESGACESWNTRPIEDALLEALERCKTYLDDYYPGDACRKAQYEAHTDCMELANSAIARAEGEA